MELGWQTIIQAIILAACTAYMRRGSKADTAQVVRSTAAQSTSDEILARVRAVELDLQLVKTVTLKDAVIDHRGPSRTNQGDQNG